MDRKANQSVEHLPVDSTVPVTTESFTSFKELTDYRQAWDEFVKISNGGAFMSFDWLATWWKYYSAGRDLKIYVFRADNKIVGLLPLFRERIPGTPIGVKVIKIVGSDFSPVTIGLPIQKKYIQAVIRQLLAELNKDFQYELLYLGEISALYPDGKPVIEALEACKKTSLKVSSRKGGPQTQFHVFDNFDSQISDLGKHERKKLRRNHKAMAENEFMIDVSYADSDTFNQYFGEFTELHHRSWQERGRPGHFLAWPSSTDFHRELAYKFLKNGKLWLQKITFDGKIVGLVYSFVMGDVLYEYLDGRDLDFKHSRVSFSRLSFVKQMERARDNDICSVDSMRGEYDYKLVLGGYLAPTLNIFVYRNTLGVIAKLFIWRVIFKINHILYYRIWRARIAPRFGISMKPLQRFWIKSSMLTL